MANADDQEPRGLDDDDAEAASDDPSDATEPDAPVDPPAPRRRGRTLLLLGGAVWAIAGWVRCAGHPAGEPLVVIPDAGEVASGPDRSEPAHAQPPAGEPADATLRTAAAQPDDDDDAIPEEDRPPPDWLSDLEPPRIVHYQIRRGGSMKNVANLFKIYHHEIVALNPGVDLESELAPGTKLVVYKAKSDLVSESIGLPSAGSLSGGVPMLDGPGRRLKAIPWKTWGSAHTVATLDRILRQWSARGSSVQPILVGNMSAREGGRLEPHSTHQSGRDVDLGYIQRLGSSDELEWREMTANNLDAAETWKLLELLRESGKVEVIYIDRAIQKLLHENAVQRGISKSALKRWMEYPRPGAVARAFIQHVPGHTDHLHVRFSCTAGESRCKSRG